MRWGFHGRPLFMPLAKMPTKRVYGLPSTNCSVNLQNIVGGNPALSSVDKMFAMSLAFACRRVLTSVLNGHVGFPFRASQEVQISLSAKPRRGDYTPAADPVSSGWEGTVFTAGNAVAVADDQSDGVDEMEKMRLEGCFIRNGEPMCACTVHVKERWERVRLVSTCWAGRGHKLTRTIRPTRDALVVGGRCQMKESKGQDHTDLRHPPNSNDLRRDIRTDELAPSTKIEPRLSTLTKIVIKLTKMDIQTD
ncbi:hypothetical protein B0H14DRAFT_2645500 [Mycena olivaceomarginata]|nr:hypothetical protein B0H14DRAFT_2645500 [Mycena olivaceomarginata]